MASGTEVNEVVSAPVQEKVPGLHILAREKGALQRHQAAVDAAYGDYDNYDNIESGYDNYDNGLYHDH